MGTKCYYDVDFDVDAKESRRASQSSRRMQER